MRIGTKSVLFGVHQFILHPLILAIAWKRLYGFPWGVRLWFAFFLHDIGYIGKPNMDGEEGEEHPEVGAAIMRFLFGDEWGDFTLLHSRFYAKKLGRQYSKLCVADKLAITLTPQWLYLVLSNLTGEIDEYMGSEHARSPAQGRSQKEWLTFVQKYCRDWAYEHREIKEDTWTEVRS